MYEILESIYSSNLTWRDVQHLVVFTANPEPLLLSGEFITNCAGRKGL